ncbi:MAG TPA: STAS domain-containing protein [Spongiibacteraceae bacterium]|nr:STAS domain-containing protein [Spongiibacteraceae bacterium]
MARASLAITGGTLSISGVLDFESVLDLDMQGQQWLAQDAPARCEIDLADVTYSSSVGIALLLGWMRAAQQAGRKLSLKNVPADMLALAHVGGIESLLTSV